jgi:hypothetical protein
VISKYESKRVEFLSIGVSVLIREKRPLTQKIVSAGLKGLFFFNHDLPHIDKRILILPRAVLMLRCHVSNPDAHSGIVAHDDNLTLILGQPVTSFLHRASPGGDYNILNVIIGKPLRVEKIGFVIVVETIPFCFSCLKWSIIRL